MHAANFGLRGLFFIFSFLDYKIRQDRQPLHWADGSGAGTFQHTEIVM